MMVGAHACRCDVQESNMCTWPGLISLGLAQELNNNQRLRLKATYEQVKVSILDFHHLPPLSGAI
jgi:hypothetical protein